ncbi:MAG: hypothetical protein D6812_04900 [Deltaproteobacteria bacterium]|nr:MAG: hypothetical protein D6812_04900 [Deltaproteobacteria bacterium]
MELLLPGFPDPRPWTGKGAMLPIKEPEMSKRIPLLLLALLFLLAAPLCQEPENTNLTIVGDLGVFTPIPEGKVVGEISLSTTLMLLRRFSFEMESQGPGSGEIEYEGPFIIDLLGGAGQVPEGCVPEQPALAMVEEGVYEAIEFDLHKGDEIDPTCPLFDQSVYMTGAVVCLDGTIPFRYVDDFNERFEVAGVCPFTVEADDISEILVVFALEKWLENVDLCAAMRSEAGIVIDDENNPEIQQQIRNNIRDSADAGEDLDGDGELDGEDCPTPIGLEAM